VRDTTGEPVRIGHLYHIATHPAARRQGHAAQLLAQATQALQALDCQWAILGFNPARPEKLQRTYVRLTLT
jgi:ribosomal protein S18 acetylase RimI-like enzyme